MSAEGRKRLAGFDVMRGILILAIVFAHSLEIGALASEPGKTLYYLSEIFLVPAIVFLSGYFLKREKITVRWAVENSLYYLALFFAAKLMYYGMYRLVDGVLPPWTQPSVWGEMAAPWYMLSLAEWYVLLLLLVRANVWAVGLLGVAAALLAGFFPSVGGMLSLSRTLVFFPFFFLGFALPKEKLQAWLLSRSTAGRLAASAGLAALLALTGVWILHRPQLYGMTLNLLYGNCCYGTALAASFGPESGVSVSLCAAFRGVSLLFATACIALLLVAVTGIQSRLRIWDALAYAGRNTLPVYIAHFPILLFLWRRVVPTGMSGAASCAVAYALGIIVAATLAWCPLKTVLSGLKRLCSWIVGLIIHERKQV